MSGNKTDSYVLYYGLSGYGVTVFFLGINILSFLIANTAIILNGIIVKILFRAEFREDVSCIFICHLALSDFFCGILLLYNTLYNLIHYKEFYECAIRFGLVNGVFLHSFIVLLNLTLERYAKIILPYRYMNMITPARAKLIMRLSLFICIAFCQAPLYGWNQDTSEEFCRYFGVFTKGFLQVYSSVMVLITFLVFMMYCHILYIAFQQTKKISLDNGRCNQKHFWWRPTKTTLIIVGFHLFSWLPTGAFVCLCATEELDYLSLGEKGTILTYVTSIIFLNSIVNPLIYAFKIKKVRRILGKIFKLKDESNFVTEFELKESTSVKY